MPRCSGWRLLPAVPRPGGRPGSAGTGLTQDGRRSDDSHSSIHPTGIKGWGCKSRTVCTQLQSHRCPWDWPPWLLRRSHPTSASSAGKESACSVRGVLTSSPPPPPGCSAHPSRASHPQAHSSPGLEESYCWPHFADERLGPGEMPGKEREPKERAKQNRA